MVREFLKQAAAGEPGAAEKIDGSSLQIVKTGDRLTAVKHMGGGGPVVVPIAKIAPKQEIKSISARVRYKARTFQVAVEFANGRWAAFEVGRKNEKLQIVGVPDDLTAEKPQPNPWD